MPYSQALSDAQAEQARRIIFAGDTTDNFNRPDYECPSYVAQMELARVVRDVYQGTAHMRKRGETYLPQLERESNKMYNKRLLKAKLFNATRRTVEGLAGMVFRRDPALGEDVPGRIAEEAENIDLAGRALPVFAKDVFTAGLVDGISFVHVDHPPAGPRLTRADDRRLGLRPLWNHVLLEDLINWRWEVQNGKSVLTLAVIRETGVEAEGAFGQREVQRYRVLRPGEFEVWEEDDTGGKKRWELADDGPVALGYIPLFPFHARRKDFFEGEPPLLDLAYENIGHWELASEREKSRTIAHIPLLFMAGFPEDEVLGISESLAFRTSDSSAKLEWVVYEGQALAESRQDLKDIEARMAALGLSMLVRETRAAETAEAKTIDKAESDSSLATAARSLGDCLENALQAHAGFLKLGSGGSVAVNTDFNEQRMDPQLLAAYSAMVGEGKLPLEVLWQMMVEGELLPEDFDPEVALAQLATAGMPETGGGGGSGDTA